ncbi:MAG TPA: hypothetical protein VMU20_01605 [Candidatus Dormibacteraeota bacterium]|nr:hypothetical protein [Candidatus Dormibacteraeota bacterium]
MHLPATTLPVPVRRLLAASMALTCGLGVFLVVQWPGRASADTHYPAAAVGNDISFPQCGHSYPDHAAYGIAGVTGGRAFTANPCFGSEYRWAREAGSPVSVYFNINYARPGYLSFGAHALDGPAGRCAPTQNPCTAYNYGWNAAADAVDRAGDAGADPQMWWLDVETVNYWADPPDRALNARVIQAALDMLRSRGLSAGVYSINEMWSRIAGTQYRPGVPVWYAETDPATGYPSAPHYCDPAYGFTGGAVWLVQWTDTVDHDYACRLSSAPAQPTPAPGGLCLPRPLPLCVLTAPPPPAPRAHLP